MNSVLEFLDLDVLGKPDKGAGSTSKDDAPFLSVLGQTEKQTELKPTRGDLVAGRINRSLLITAEPTLVLDLRGG
jgi:hypothetical protein